MKSRHTSKDVPIEELPKNEESFFSQLDMETGETKVSPEEPIICLHFLLGISSLKTWRIQGYNKHHKVFVLIDSGNTHNFINQCKVEEAD